MKTLKDSILEKLKVDDIILYEKFPIDGTVDDIVEFLKDNNFIIIEEGKPQPTFIIRRHINNAHKRICFIYKFMNQFLLRFADASKKEISTKNPLFILIRDYNSYKYKTASQYDDGIKELNKEEFAKLVNKRFR